MAFELWGSPLAFLFGGFFGYAIRVIVSIRSKKDSSIEELYSISVDSIYILSQILEERDLKDEYKLCDCDIRLLTDIFKRMATISGLYGSRRIQDRMDKIYAEIAKLFDLDAEKAPLSIREGRYPVARFKNLKVALEELLEDLEKEMKMAAFMSRVRSKRGLRVLIPHGEKYDDCRQDGKDCPIVRQMLIWKQNHCNGQSPCN